MRFVFALVISVAAALLPVAQAVEPPTVELVGMDPPAGANVPKNAALYVHLRYRSDQPLRVQVKGFFQGVEVQHGVRWNPAPPNPAGAGEAIAWLSFSTPAHLDELRVEISDAKWTPLVTLKVPRNVAWTGLTGELVRAEWVARLSDAQQNATNNDLASIGESGALIYLVGLVTMLSVPGYFVLQTLFGLRWAGGWRVAALVPLLIMVPAMGHAVFALAAGSNLWPIVVIFCAPIGFIYLVIVAIARHFEGARRTAA